MSMTAGRRGLFALADGDNPLEDPIALFIVQLVFIIVLSRALGYLLKYIKQPQVIAEVITGIILGPTVLGNIPHYKESLFPSVATITVFANIGLIFFMFLIGIELDPGLLKRNAKSASIVAIASMALPFGIGCVLSILLYNMYADHNVKFSTFLLFVGVAMSITAFPVLARILTETRLTGAKVGLISLSAAAVNDVVAWILLAVVVSIAHAKSPVSTVWTLLIMVGFFLLMLFVVRPLLIRLNNKAQSSAQIRHQMVMLTFILVLASAWFTEVIGIHAIFGGFVMGVISPRDHGWAIYITERIEDVVIMVLLPLYFTVSGLNTNLTTLNDGEAWGICFLVIALACFGKIVGSLGAAKLLGNTWRESVTVGILMNTKGLVELIVLNLGLQAGVLTPKLFSIFVMMAVITTMLTSPLLHVIWIRDQKKKATPFIHDSFSVMMCISNQVSGLAMVSVAGTLAVQKKKKFTLQALHVTEVTESPSSYFFAHKRPPPPFLDLIKERTRALSVPLKIKQIFAVNVAADIDIYCSSKHFDIILIASNEPILEKGGSKIKQVLAHTPSTVGVLVNRGIEEIVQIHKVLALYEGDAHQKDALKIVRLMCRKPGVEVTIISSVPLDEMGLDQEPINFIFSDTVTATGIEESKKDYDLIVVGIPREWNANENVIAPTSELVITTPASVLLVHPKMEGLAKKKKKDKDQQEHAKLFWGVDSKLIAMKNRKSKDISADSDSSSSSHKDGALWKSKSKLRIDANSSRDPIMYPEHIQVDENNNFEMPVYTNDDFPRKRSHADELHKPHTPRGELSRTTSLSQSQSHESFHAIPILPPPPQPQTPRSSQSMVGSGITLHTSTSSPSIVPPPSAEPPSLRRDDEEDDLVYVD